MSIFVSDSRFIMDLGMNNGDDTAYYLAKGFNVVAVEANPALVAAATKRFATEIAAKQVTILPNAVAGKAGHVSFFINEHNDHWSSMDKGWAGREDSACHAIQVEALTLGQIFDRFGIPYYLKIDVEGADKEILSQLGRQLIKPLYVSVEDCRFGFEYIEMLAAAGYDGFKLLDQSTVHELHDDAIGYKFPPGSSGPFGRALPGQWLSRWDMHSVYARTVRDRSGTRLAPRTRWWDIHATRR
ncbi:FkbM family methyltransferase [Roseixanthobacter pseudopolyaromaticivorans]|uniref:FkbM family methyltransferase n=1 Tax=Xanthobacteraceae TaxID=335928 RepID=UPI003727AF2F